jgi:hypothetical protein
MTRAGGFQDRVAENTEQGLIQAETAKVSREAPKIFLINFSDLA